MKDSLTPLLRCHGILYCSVLLLRLAPKYSLTHATHTLLSLPIFIEYEDPDKSESGLMYFDLPDIEEEEETSNSNNKSTPTIRPAFVEQFWRFIFSLFLLDWLRNKGEQQKRIKHE